MCLQIGVLRCLDIKVKEIKTYTSFYNCSLETFLVFPKVLDKLVKSVRGLFGHPE